MVRNTSLPAFIRVSFDDIARRAYEMYLERGGPSILAAATGGSL
jgi:hypothetical protein